MILDSLLLMVVGMSVVIMFLIILMVLIFGLGRMMKNHSLKEEADLYQSSKNNVNKKNVDQSKIVAIISAAVQAHRKARGLS